MNPPTKTTTGALKQRISRHSRYMLLALVVGGVLGWLVPELEAWLKPIGGLFERMMEMLLAPLLITTLIGWSTQVVWSARAPRPSIKRGAWKVTKLALVSLACFTLASTAAMFIGATTANLVKPLKNDNDTTAKNGAAKAAEAKGTCGSYRKECTAANVFWTPEQATTISEPAGKNGERRARDQLLNQFGEFLDNLVPTSIFEALYKNWILKIMIFSMLTGMAIGMVARRSDVARVSEIANTGTAALYKLVDYAMYAAPVGVGVATAAVFGATTSRLTASTSLIIPLLKCIAGLYGALIVFLLLLIGLMILVLHITKDKETRRVRYDWRQVLGTILEPALLAFATTTSKAALPRAMQALTELGIPRRVVSFVIPAGFSLNLAGSALFLPFAATVIAQHAIPQHAGGGGQPLLEAQLLLVLALTLLSKNIVGLPGVSFCMLIALLGGPYSPVSDGNPQAVTEALCALACIDMIMDMGRTCTNVVGNCIVTVLVAVVFDHGPPEPAADDGASDPVAQG